MKGYYKRAKAHAAVWNEKEARRDFNMVAHLDVTLASLVQRELRAMSERIREKYWEEKEQYWNMLEKNEQEEEEEEGEEGEGDGEDAAAESSDQVGAEEAPGSPSKSTAGDKEETSAEETGAKEDASSKAEDKGWQQMLRLVMLLQNEGNFLIKENNFQDASAKFREALQYVDICQKMVSVIM